MKKGFRSQNSDQSKSIVNIQKLSSMLQKYYLYLLNQASYGTYLITFW
ncbi:hypothetical protein MPB37_002845 [Listeria monocytogenes]|nr:hypothetical protein [Listeria monocytogenes]MCB2461833.1 hypothetical protein [Listeria monocytogenes]